MSTKSLSIIIPCKNEEKSIYNVLESVWKYHDKFKIEVLVVDDGSIDNTYKKALDFIKDKENISIIHHSHSRGLGGVFWSAINYASGEYVFIVPGDGENDIDSMFNLFETIKDEDIVICYVKNKQMRTLFRQLLSATFTFILNLTFQKNLKYYNGTSIYKRTSLLKIIPECSGFFFSAEIVLKFLKLNLKYKEIGVLLNKVEKRKSNALSFYNLGLIIVDYLKLIKYWYF